MEKKLKWRCSQDCERHCEIETLDLYGEDDGEFPITCLYGHGEIEFELVSPETR
jgi:hypothetical protein